jgi:hypothetical protein
MKTANTVKTHKTRKHEAEVIELIKTNGFTSYYALAKQLVDTYPTIEKVHVSAIRRLVIRLASQKKIVTDLPEAKKPLILTTKEEIIAKYGTTRITPKIERELVNEGFTKQKSKVYPFKVTYTK